MQRAVRRVVTAAVEYGVTRAGIAVVRALDRDAVGQGHHPRGAAGSVTGWVFAHRPSNRQRNGWVVSLLDVQPAGQVLEIGFGPGVAVTELARAGAGHVYGIGHSGVMLAELRRRLAPGGRIAIASQPRCPGATAGTSRSAADEVQDLLRSAGFTQMRTETLSLSPPVICVLAAAPGSDAKHTPQT
jgi:hypothetical protein